MFCGPFCLVADFGIARFDPCDVGGGGGGHQSIWHDPHCVYEMNSLPFVGGLTGVELSRGAELSRLWYWAPFVVVPLCLPGAVRAGFWVLLIVLLVIFDNPSVTTVAASVSISLLACRSYIPCK